MATFRSFIFKVSRYDVNSSDVNAVLRSVIRKLTILNSDCNFLQTSLALVDLVGNNQVNLEKTSTIININLCPSLVT